MFKGCAFSSRPHIVQAAAIDDALKSRTHAGVAPANSNRGTAAWLLNR